MALFILPGDTNFGQKSPNIIKISKKIHNRAFLTNLQEIKTTKHNNISELNEKLLKNFFLKYFLKCLIAKKNVAKILGCIHLSC